MTKRVKTKNSSVYPFLDKRQPMADGINWPVRLTVSLNGEQFRVNLKIYTTEEIFNKAVYGKGSMPKEARFIKDEIDNYLDKAKTILSSYPNINRDKFRKLFNSEADLSRTDKTPLSILFQKKIDELTEEDRAGSIEFYAEAKSVFSKFRKNPCLEDIDVQWLKAFRTWYMAQGNSHATVQIHFRSLRHIYNRAIKDNIIAIGLYPFHEYKIGTASKSKDVLYPEEIEKLWNYKTNIYAEKRAKDYWFFLYLSSGMNIKDALSLKGANVKGNVITFIRSKTSNTKQDVEEIIVFLHDEAKTIMQKWGQLDNEDYIFPAFRGTKTEVERLKIKRNTARNLNRSLREIGEKLGFNVNLTLNLARHSFATKLNIDGVNTSMIKDALGHSSAKTTEHYMKTLPVDNYRKISDNLLNFKRDK